MQEWTQPEALSSQPPRAEHNEPVLHLLAPGTRIPLRYRQLAAQLRDWELPDALVQVGLVLRLVERGVLPPDRLAALPGTLAVEVAGALAALACDVPRPSLQQFEQTWKLFILTYLHPAASVLKLTEMLMQLRHSADTDVTLPAETIVAAAHVCARLGMWDVRAELLDACTRLADPGLVQKAQTLLERSEPVRAQFFEMLRQQLSDRLGQQGISAHIERRPRPVHQVVEDGLGTRGTFPWADVVVVLVDNVQDCYRAMGEINIAYPVIGGKVRDYIGGPKDNGYQALHTAIEFSSSLNGASRTAPVDIRITTAERDRVNHRGYLAFLAGTGVMSACRSPWWTNRQRWLATYHGHSDEAFFFTPKGELVFLPRGATVLDFAVRVHSDLGVYCRGAQVNGHQASPDDRLECGDICEVLIDPYSEPVHYRLLARAGTSATRSRIRRAMQRDHSGAVRGQHTFREVLTRRLAEQEIHTSETIIQQHVAGICRKRGYQTAEAFYRAVARGEAAPDQVVRTIIDMLLVPRLEVEALPEAVRARMRRVRLALCCRPRPSQPAVAVPIHNGHELKIHTATCSHVTGSVYSVHWKSCEAQAYVVDVLYEGWDRPGLIHRVTGAIDQIDGINLLSFTATVPEPSLARLNFSMEAPSRAVIEQVRVTLEQLPERRNVDIRTVTLIDEGLRLAEPLANPYGPQPVGRWPLFVGRSNEISQIVAHLNNSGGSRHILIRGPKRIGKSSLLQHLSRYHLADFAVPELVDLQSVPTEELYFTRLLARFAELITGKVRPAGRGPTLDMPALERDPVRTFGRFLASVRQDYDLDRLVILIDEFGVLFSRPPHPHALAEFFDQWRALLSDPVVSSHLAFVVVLPDQPGMPPHTGHDERVPLRLGELGYPVRLAVLDPHDAHDLITTPIHTHLMYHPDDLDLLLYETGGHPYYIHLVCSAVVTTIQVQQRRNGFRMHERQQIPTEIIRSALASVAAHDDAFYHVLNDSTSETGAVLRAVAYLSDEQHPRVDLAELHTAPGEGVHLDRPGVIWRAVQERPDLLVEQDGQLGIRVALVARWLRRRV